MVALGCKFLRICHLNNCATGVATQERQAASGSTSSAPEMVMNYFTFIARRNPRVAGQAGRAQRGRADWPPGSAEHRRRSDQQAARPEPERAAHPGNIPADEPRFCVTAGNPSLTRACWPSKWWWTPAGAVPTQAQVLEYPIRNINRSIGARLSGEIARRHGAEGLPDGMPVKFTGSAGQSFGVWNAKGLALELEGDANDYVGKGMTGGSLVIYPPKNSTFASNEAIIVGNTCLYGATGGELYAAGLAGERFGVRNSGALAVIEGAGDHCCEYMTGGCDRAGRNRL